MSSPTHGRARACVRALAGGSATEIDVRAQPHASRSGFAGFWNGMPKIAVAAPPEDGRANEEIVAAVARLFDVRSSAVELVRGQKSRLKSLRLACAPHAVLARLDALEAGIGVTGSRRANEPRSSDPPASRPDTPGDRHA